MTAMELGTTAPAFDLPATDGSSYSFDSLAAGKAAVIVFTCNHCPYAKAWEDRILDVGREYAGRGVTTAAINSNNAAEYPDDSFDAMKARASDKNYAIPYLYDESQAVAHAYGAERTPEVFLFDSERNLRYHGAVDDNQDETKVGSHYLRDAIEAVLAGADPAVTQTEAVGCTIKWK